MILAQCFQSLKMYGREPEQLEATTGIFQMVLADYPIAKIESAFKAYIKRSNEMPAPADIVNLIERGNKPPLDRAVYTSFSKKHPENRTHEEWAYMREYEQFMVRGDW